MVVNLRTKDKFDHPQYSYKKEGDELIVTNLATKESERMTRARILYRLYNKELNEFEKRLYKDALKFYF